MDDVEKFPPLNKKKKKRFVSNQNSIVLRRQRPKECCFCSFLAYLMIGRALAALRQMRSHVR